MARRDQLWKNVETIRVRAFQATVNVLTFFSSFKRMAKNRMKMMVVLFVIV
jgi:hypothetical protein